MYDVDTSMNLLVAGHSMHSSCMLDSLLFLPWEATCCGVFSPYKESVTPLTPSHYV